MEFTTFHLHPEGADNGAGTEADPWTSLPEAVVAIRKRRAAGEISGKVRLRLHPGTYRLSRPLELGTADSGLEITGSARSDVIVSGGRVVEHIREEQLDGRRVWVADFPDGWRDRLDFRQLWVNGKRRPRARYPKFDPAGAGQDAVLHMETVRGLDDPNFLTGADYAFKPHDGDVEAWTGLYDAEIVALHFWVEDRLTHPHFDPVTGWVECSRKSVFRLTEDFSRKPARYYIDNLREAMTEPGEWFYAKREGRLYYLPFPAEKPDRTELLVPVVRQFLRVVGDRYNTARTHGDPHHLEPASGIRLHGLRFRHADWFPVTGKSLDHDSLDPPEKPWAGNAQAAANVPAVLEFRQARDCHVESCRVEHVGLYGLSFGPGARHCSAVGNAFSDLGAGGIKLVGTELDGPPHGRTGYCTLTDNTIRDAGRVFHSAVGIFIALAFENVVAHNRIENLFYTGISLGWSWGYKETATRDNLILNNRIRNIGQGLLNDMGAVYTLGVQPGTVIAGNHVSGVRLHAYGGWGMYLDEGSSHMVVEGNLVHDIQGPCLNIHYGRENIVRNNLFIGGKGGIGSVGRQEGHTALNFLQNVLLPTEGLVYSGGYDGDPSRAFRAAVNLIGRRRGRPLHFKRREWDRSDKVPWKEWTQSGHDLTSTLVKRDELPPATWAHPERADWSRILGKPFKAMGITFPDWRKCGPRPAAKRRPLRQPLTRKGTEVEILG